MDPRVGLPLCLVMACGGGEPGGGGDAGAVDAAGEIDAAGPVTYPRPCGDLFDQELLPTFEVTIQQSEWDQIVDEYMNWQAREDLGLPLKPYHPLLELRYGDETVADAMIRLKGNPCCSWFGPKMQFVISFNELDPEGRFHGLRKIALDAPPYDPSFLKNRLALAYLRDLGLPASCANNARLNVNGAYYGLYTSIEHMDKEFLQRQFPGAEAEGNLYKYGWELKTNETVGDVTRRDLWWNTYDFAGMDALADLDEVAAEWAAEAMIPHADGYFAGSGNFYIYDHPTRGFLFIPWDLDYTFDAAPVDADPIGYRAPWGGATPHFDALVDDPVGGQMYRDALIGALAAYVPAKLAGWIDVWRAQILTAASDDPNKPFPFDQHPAAVDSLRGYLQPRVDYLNDWLICSGGGGTDGDGDGYTWCNDCNDLDPAISPGATETCDGVDQDCTGIADDSDLCPDCTELPFGAARFLFCTRPRTWANSLLNCTNQGGTLATSLDGGETGYLGATVGSLGVNDEWWIGANDLSMEGTWTDPAGVPLTYLPWNPGSPNGGDTENCGITVASFGGLWKDRLCEELRPSVCRLP